MNKKETKVEEKIIPTEPIEEVKSISNKYPREERDFLQHLWKTPAPTSVQVSRMLDLYRKYINPNQPDAFRANCASCSSTIVLIFNNFRDWFSKNGDKFESAE